MTEQVENPYQVLGVERSADERAIKKAYFTLIRKFPPETHAEEFQRLRRAYELLSDPTARRRYDSLDRDYGEYGEQIGAALRSVEESAKAGDDAEVQRKLREILEQRPDLAVARENLALSLARTGAFAEALDMIKALIADRPEEARYYLHKAYALHRLEKPEKAESALRKAHKIRPDDVRIHLELVDFLLGYGKWGKAIDELDAMLAKQPPGSDVGLLLRLRRVEALCSASDPGADAEVTGLIDGLDRDKDPEIGRFVATQLGIIAARLFARNEGASANALLRRASELYPESPVLRPYPEHVTLDYFALPDDGRRWLAALKPGPPSPTLGRPIWLVPVCAILGAVAVASVTLLLLFDEPGRWDATSLVAAALAVGASVAALAWVGRRVIGILQSPLRAFVTVHPLYLILAEARRIDIYPLFNLVDVRGTHQHTNGAYTHTAFALKFGKKSVSVSVKGQEYAEGWLQFLLQSRRRAIELMGEGFLEAEHGIELLPPALLHDTRVASLPGAGRRFYAGAAAAALVVFAAVVGLRARAADDHAFGQAVRAGTTAAYQRYLAGSPDGRHAEEARHEIARKVERARAAVRSKIDAGAPGGKALLAALDALEARGTKRAALVVEAPSGGGDAGAAAAALADRLNARFDAAGLDAALELELRAAPDPAAPVTLVVRSEARPDGAKLAVQPEKAAQAAPTVQAVKARDAQDVEDVSSFQVDWEVELVAAGAPEPLWRWKTTVPAPEELRLPRPTTGPGVSAEARAALKARATETFLRELSGALGLGSAPPVAKVGGLGVVGGVRGGTAHGR